MVLIEFRVPLPLTASEFHRGQLYMVAEQSLEATDGAEGVEWVKNERFDNRDGHMPPCPITGVAVPKAEGQYTLKRYFLKSKVPGIVAALVPTDALYLIEVAFNCYPKCLTVLINGYLSREKFKIEVETMHVDGNIDEPNAVGLTPAELAIRKVEYIDILDGHADPKAKEYDARFDCSKVKSEKTGRGPLTKGWERRTSELGLPLMCCYKVIRADFKYFGMQSKIENTIINSQRDLFGRTLAAAFGTIDKWSDKSMDEIREMEREVARRAETKLKGTAGAAPLPALPPGAMGGAAAAGAGGGSA